MELNGIYKLSYTLDREPKDLILSVELRQIEGLMKKGQNVWCGYATLDKMPYEKTDLSHCVNARLAAQRIGRILKDELKAKAKESNQVLRVKKEEIK
jgi:hypothetical protein